MQSDQAKKWICEDGDSGDILYGRYIIPPQKKNYEEI
jgi:hypothetical protein